MRVPGERRPHRRRVLLVGALVLVTVVAAAVWLLGRSGGGSSNETFGTAERDFVTAAAAVHLTPGAIHNVDDIDAFNKALDDQALVMERSLDQFHQVAQSEEGDAQAIAQSAVESGTAALRAVSHLRDAIVSSRDLAAAGAALDEMDRAVDDLKKEAAQWRRL
jgi:hypothetical protein